MNEFLHELDKTVTDQVTGFRGTIVARAQYVSQENNYLVQPKCIDPKEMPAAVWIDENRLQ